jgi:hypothetical protein
MKLFISAEKPEPQWVKLDDKVKFLVAQLDLQTRRIIMESKHAQSNDAIANGYWAIRQKIKFAIKGWEGIEDQHGNKIECQLTPDGKELVDDVWVPLVEREDTAFTIYQAIAPQFELTEEQKKS